MDIPKLQKLSKGSGFQMTLAGIPRAVILYI